MRLAWLVFALQLWGCPDQTDVDDLGVPAKDTGAIDTAVDAAADTGAETGMDAAEDAGTDGGEADADATIDAGEDAGSDAGEDSGDDAGEDAGDDASLDAGDDAGPVGAPSCKAILAADPLAPDGMYLIDPDGAIDTSTDAADVYCDMTTLGGGWTEVHAFGESDVDLLLGSSARQLVKCSDAGAEHIASPVFSEAWSWGGLGFRQVGGAWIVNGMEQTCGTDPEYTDVVCPSWWGFGCGNGPFALNKLFPGVLDAPAAGTCADDSSAHTNGAFSICGSNNYRAYRVFVRSEDPAPTCSNGLQDGAETDTDCGGPFCAACASYCDGCAEDRDCAAGTCAGGRCIFSTGELSVDYLAHCSTAMTVLFSVPNVPAGTYLITALGGGVTVWPPPWSPPSFGWFYQIPCSGLDAYATDRLRTTSYYASATDAFAALTATTATTSFAGGTLECPVFDMPCSDNAGQLRFRMDMTCP